MKQPFVYIMANKKHGTIYTGVTSNLIKRVYEYKHKIFKGFTSQYNCNLLVYFEQISDMESAIFREKYLKSKSRKKKTDLIEKMNPDWKDLYENII